MPLRIQNNQRLSVRRAARKRRYRPIPMSSGLFHDRINVLLQQVAVLRQRIGGCSDPMPFSVFPITVSNASFPSLSTVMP